MDYHRQLCALGHWRSSRTNGHGNLPPTSDLAQPAPENCHGQCVPATGSTRTRWIWVSLLTFSLQSTPPDFRDSVMKLGQGARDIFPITHTLEQPSGPTFYAIGFLVALILWAFGLVWLFFALASILYSRKFPFNIGWWGFTFPLGVFATSTCEMANELPSEFFAVLGTVSFLSLDIKTV